jgi:hypothetical protein
MPTAVVRFRACLQDSQEYGSNEEHMVSRVTLTLEAEGRRYPDLMVDVKQSVGSDFETAPLEVSRPHGYDGHLDYAAFRQLVEAYYRSLVGTQGSTIRIAPGAQRIRMRNNIIVRAMTATFEYEAGAPAW